MFENIPCIPPPPSPAKTQDVPMDGKFIMAVLKIVSLCTQSHGSLTKTSPSEIKSSSQIKTEKVYITSLACAPAPPIWAH